MGIVIDCLVVLVMASCIFVGYKKGLMKVAINFIAIFLSIILALILYKPVANFIVNNTELDEKINSGVYEKIKDEDFYNLSDEAKDKNGLLQISDKYINEAIQSSKDNVAQYVSDRITETIINGIAFVIVVIALRVVLILLYLLSDVIASLPIIKQFNKSGGILYGIIEGLFFVNLVFAILYVLNPVCLNGKIDETVQKSNLGKLAYNDNIIINMIGK